LTVTLSHSVRIPSVMAFPTPPGATTEDGVWADPAAAEAANSVRNRARDFMRELSRDVALGPEVPA
jgi:hypothetical protein